MNIAGKTIAPFAARSPMADPPGGLSSHAPSQPAGLSPGQSFGDGAPAGPYIIAEIGVNHDGLATRAAELTELALDAGADAVKFQLFRADLLMSHNAELAEYQRSAGETDPAEMLRRLELPLEAMGRCIERIHGRGKHAIVTVFSLPLVARAQELPWDAYKTASPDIIHKPLLDALVRTGKPMIVSTGAAERDEVVRALGWLQGASERLALLQCVSSYPCDLGDANIGAMADLAIAIAQQHQHNQPVVGYSDHTAAVDTGALAVRCGASILEKHFTDDRSRPGPDHSASLDLAGFSEYVKLARAAWADAQAGTGKPFAAMAGDPRIGAPNKRILDCERDVRRVSRQSVVYRRDLPAGHIVAPQDICYKRPGTGLAPHEAELIIGQVLSQAVRADEPARPTLVRGTRAS